MATVTPPDRNALYQDLDEPLPTDSATMKKLIKDHLISIAFKVENVEKLVHFIRKCENPKNDTKILRRLFDQRDFKHSGTVWIFNRWLNFLVEGKEKEVDTILSGERSSSKIPKKKDEEKPCLYVRGIVAIENFILNFKVITTKNQIETIKEKYNVDWVGGNMKVRKLVEQVNQLNAHHAKELESICSEVDSYLEKIFSVASPAAVTKSNIIKSEDNGFKSKGKQTAPDTLSTEARTKNPEEAIALVSSRLIKRENEASIPSTVETLKPANTNDIVPKPIKSDLSSYVQQKRPEPQSVPSAVLTTSSTIHREEEGEVKYTNVNETRRERTILDSKPSLDPLPPAGRGILKHSFKGDPQTNIDAISSNTYGNQSDPRLSARADRVVSLPSHPNFKPAVRRDDGKTFNNTSTLSRNTSSVYGRDNYDNYKPNTLSARDSGYGREDRSRDKRDDRSRDNRPICKYFASGKCRSGSSCRFRHETRGLDDRNSSTKHSYPISPVTSSYGGASEWRQDDRRDRNASKEENSSRSQSNYGGFNGYNQVNSQSAVYESSVAASSNNNTASSTRPEDDPFLDVVNTRVKIDPDKAFKKKTDPEKEAKIRFYAARSKDQIRKLNQEKAMAEVSAIKREREQKPYSNNNFSSSAGLSYNGNTNSYGGNDKGGYGNYGVENSQRGYGSYGSEHNNGGYGNYGSEHNNSGYGNYDGSEHNNSGYGNYGGGHGNNNKRKNDHQVAAEVKYARHGNDSRGSLLQSNQPSIRDRTLGTSTTPGAGRGRGRGVNLPAWMTKNDGGEAGSLPSNNGAGGSMGSVPSTFVPNSEPAKEPNFVPYQSTKKFVPKGSSVNVSGRVGQTKNNAPINVLARNNMGRGRGRGRGVNLPAWMTQGQN